MKATFLVNNIDCLEPALELNAAKNMYHTKKNFK